MKENIVCSGALFYSTGTKRFLFLQRTDKKTQGMWGLVGGKSKFTESAFEGLKREIEEEVGQTQVAGGFAEVPRPVCVRRFRRCETNCYPISLCAQGPGPREENCCKYTFVTFSDQFFVSFSEAGLKLHDADR